MKKKLLLSGIIFLCLFTVNFNVFAQNEEVNDWIQFRGKHSTGISGEKLNLEEFKDAELIWKKEIGAGFSELIISSDKVYTMYCEKIDSVSGFDVLAAFDAGTGNLLWKNNVDSVYIEIDGWGDGPRSTPTIDEFNVYCLSGNGKLAAYKKDGSKILWSYDLVKDFGSDRPRWGFSTSPIVIGEKLIIEVGGKESRGFVAFDKHTGNILWEKGTARAGYNSPLLTTLEGKEQLLFINGRTVQSFNLEGDTLWTYILPIAGPIVMPVIFDENKIFFSSIHSGDVTIQIKEGKPEELRKGFTMKNDFTTSIYHNGYIYGFHIAALRCINAETGEVKWSQRGFGKGSFIMVDDNIIIISDKGKLAIAKANPDMYEELTSFQAIDASRTWTAPTFANGKVYLRNHKEMACYKLN